MLTRGRLLAGLVLGYGVASTTALGAERGSNLFAGDLGNAVWTLAIFGVLLVVLGKFAWPPILAGLQHRERFIRNSLESARRDREAAESRLREYEEKLRQARDEASALVEEGRRDAELVRRQIEEEARRSAEATLERAKREIAAARDTALRELYEQSAEMATHLAGTVLKRQLSPEDHQRLVREALAELGKQAGSAN